MFVVDYGVMWVSRHQAQNAADAGALAGAIALALDDFDDRTRHGPGQASRRASFALANGVWGEQPDVQMATDVRFYATRRPTFPASCASDDCVRVDVYRNQARGNPLPMFFGWLVGVTDQGVRATATAQAAAANASDCLKPWAVADKWDENNPVGAPWDPTIRLRPDWRRRRTSTSPPTESDVPAPASRSRTTSGTKLTLKVGNPAATPIDPGWFQAARSDLPSGGGGGDCYRDNIARLRRRRPGRSATTLPERERQHDRPDGAGRRTI